MYIAFEGVIGVGKTTLARLLQPSLQAELLLEVFEENPFLSDFYADRQRYAFQTQIFFLLSRYHQQRQAVPPILAANHSLLSDYTFDKDTIFAQINLHGDELDMYYRVHEALAEKMAQPDLVVYLRADPEILLQRIALRDRPYERKMERDYIEQLHHSYEAFFARPQINFKTLVIDTSFLNFVSRPDDLRLVETRIRQALQMVPFQQELPLS